MKLPLSILFLINVFSWSSSTTATTKCPVKRCAKEETKFDPPICIWTTTVATGEAQTYDVRVSNCKGTDYCPQIFGATNTTCTPTKNRKQVHGGICDDNGDCYSEVCKSGKCVGKIQDQYCTSTDQCGPNLYCNSKNICSGLLPPGFPCKANIECERGYGCGAKTSDPKADSVCLELLSIEEKQFSPDGMFCKSGMVNPIAATLAEQTCISTTLKSTSETCTDPQTECEYEFTKADGSKATFKRQCECNDLGTGKFCPMATTHDKWKAAITTITKNCKKNVNEHVSLNNKCANIRDNR